MKTATKSPNILLNYLQATSPTEAFDITNFIPKTEILKFYESVSLTGLNALIKKIQIAQREFNKATVQAERRSALNSLNKYPQIQNLIRSGVGLDNSRESQDLKQMYNDEPLRLLDAQIMAANNFIKARSVQEQVTSDFDNGKYQAFDVNNGDNNCQSRIFLMDIFQQGLPYASLSTLEQLVLTLSNITCQYKKEVRDVFGLLVKEQDNGDIKYGSDRLLAVKVPLKIEAAANVFYSVSDLIGKAISQISCGYLLTIADTLNFGDLKQDLTPYGRKMQSSAKTKPAQQMQAPGILAMYECIKFKKYPFAYKLTRLATTALGNFSMQGAALLDMNGDKIVDVTTSPTVIFELFAVDSEQARRSYVGTDLEKLAASNTFDEYLSELKAFGIQKLINFCDVMLDKKLLQTNVVYSSAQLMTSVKESKVLGNCLSGCYAVGKYRSTKGVIFSPCHIYVGNTVSEVDKLKAIEAVRPIAGLAI